MDATLSVVSYIEGGRDGWELTLDQLASVPMESRACASSAPSSGPCTPPWGPTPPTPRSRPRPSAELSLLTATIDEQIERAFLDLPRDNEALAPIAGRGEEGSRATAGCSRTQARAAGSSATTATCTRARRCWPT